MVKQLVTTAKAVALNLEQIQRNVLLAMALVKLCEMLVDLVLLTLVLFVMAPEESLNKKIQTVMELELLMKQEQLLQEFLQG